MTTGADKNKSGFPRCRCCGEPKIIKGSICLWCSKDRRKIALYQLCPQFCNYYASPLRFCRHCLGVIATDFDVTQWLIHDWDNGKYVNSYDADEFVAEHYQEEYECLYENLCKCDKFSDGININEDYVKSTMSLQDVQWIEKMRVAKKMWELKREFYKELNKDSDK